MCVCTNGTQYSTEQFYCDPQENHRTLSVEGEEEPKSEPSLLTNIHTVACTSLQFFGHVACCSSTEDHHHAAVWTASADWKSAQWSTEAAL